MSFNISVTVTDGVATVTGQSTDTAAPPNGAYTISGHQPGAEGGYASVGVYGPTGGASGSFALPATHAPVTA